MENSAAREAIIFLPNSRRIFETVFGCLRFRTKKVRYLAAVVLIFSSFGKIFILQGHYNSGPPFLHSTPKEN